MECRELINIQRMRSYLQAVVMTNVGMNTAIKINCTWNEKVPYHNCNRADLWNVLYFWPEQAGSWTNPDSSILVPHWIASDTPLLRLSSHFGVWDVTKISGRKKK